VAEIVGDYRLTEVVERRRNMVTPDFRDEDDKMWKWLTKLGHIKPSECSLCSAWIKEEYCTNSDCYYHDHLQDCPINEDCACLVLDSIVEAEQLGRVSRGSS
jgi:hypothetical protein